MPTRARTTSAQGGPQGPRGAHKALGWGTCCASQGPFHGIGEAEDVGERILCKTNSRSTATGPLLAHFSLSLSNISLSLYIRIYIGVHMWISHVLGQQIQKEKRWKQGWGGKTEIMSRASGLNGICKRSGTLQIPSENKDCFCWTCSLWMSGNKIENRHITIYTDRI